MTGIRNGIAVSSSMGFSRRAGCRRTTGWEISTPRSSYAAKALDLVWTRPRVNFRRVVSGVSGVGTCATFEQRPLMATPTRVSRLIFLSMRSDVGRPRC